MKKIVTASIEDIYMSAYSSALNDFMNVLKLYKKEINTSNTPWNFIELCYNKLINKED